MCLQILRITYPISNAVSTDTKTMTLMQLLQLSS